MLAVTMQAGCRSSAGDSDRQAAFASGGGVVGTELPNLLSHVTEFTWCAKRPDIGEFNPFTVA